MVKFYIAACAIIALVVSFCLPLNPCNVLVKTGVFTSQEVSALSQEGFNICTWDSRGDLTSLIEENPSKAKVLVISHGTTRDNGEWVIGEPKKPVKTDPIISKAKELEIELGILSCRGKGEPKRTIEPFWDKENEIWVWAENGHLAARIDDRKQISAFFNAEKLP